MIKQRIKTFPNQFKMANLISMNTYIMVNTMTLSRFPDNVINMKGLLYVVYFVYYGIGEFDLDLIQTFKGPLWS